MADAGIYCCEAGAFSAGIDGGKPKDHLQEETLKDIQNSVPEHANKKIRYPGEGTLIRRKENTELGIPVES